MENKPKLVTFIIPIIRPDCIEACLDSLYKYTDNSIFYVYIIDQTIEGLDPKLRDHYGNLMVIRTAKSDKHPTGNLGHSQASNLGVQLTQTPYCCFLNDDVIFINSKWWQGIMDTFELVNKTTPERPAMIVNAASTKLPDWSVGRASGDDFYILPEKEEYTDADWDFLVNEDHFVNEHLTIKPGSVIDGINLYCSVCDTKKLIEVGMIDEFFYPGGANDYDLGCRASMFGYRCVGTTLSWVYHMWTVSFKSVQAQEEIHALVQDDLKHEDLRDKWGKRFDLWGVRCTKCDEIMHTEDGRNAACPKCNETYQMPETTIEEL